MRRLLIIIATFLLLTTSAYSLNYNETYSDLVLDVNGKCQDMKIVFTLYNSTEYAEYDEIMDNLCVPGCQEDRCEEDDGEDCIRCERHCREFTVIDADYTIYKGPLDAMGTFVNGSTNSSSQFEYTFPSVGTTESYLIQIFPGGEYNDREELFEVYDCKFSNSSDFKEVTLTGEVVDPTAELPIQLLNLAIVIKNTYIKGGSEVHYEDNVAAPIPLANSKSIFQLNFDSNNFTSVELTRPYTRASEDTIIEAYRYDDQLSSWEVLPTQVEGAEVVFESTEYGIFAIVERPLNEQELAQKEAEEQAESQAEAERLAQEQAESQTEAETTSSETSTSTNTQTSTVPSTSSSSSNTVIIIGVVLFVVAIIVVAVIMMGGKKAPVQAPAEVITTYQLTYQKTKEYVQQYKEEYLKDQIYRSLKEASVPKDIIDKVFAEEY